MVANQILNTIKFNLARGMWFRLTYPPTMYIHPSTFDPDLYDRMSNIVCCKLQWRQEVMTVVVYIYCFQIPTKTPFCPSSKTPIVLHGPTKSKKLPLSFTWYVFSRHFRWAKVSLFPPYTPPPLESAYTKQFCWVSTNWHWCTSTAPQKRETSSLH